MREYKWGQKIPMPYWGQTHLAALLGLTNVMLGRYINGVSYPTVQTIQKFDYVFGWPAREQIDLIPPYWTWPGHNQYGKGVKQEDPTDMRYALKLQQVIREWCDATPRTETITEIRLHPSLDTKHRRNDWSPS